MFICNVFSPDAHIRRDAVDSLELGARLLQDLLLLHLINNGGSARRSLLCGCVVRV